MQDILINKSIIPPLHSGVASFEFISADIEKKIRGLQDLFKSVKMKHLSEKNLLDRDLMSLLFL